MHKCNQIARGDVLGSGSSATRSWPEETSFEKVGRICIDKSACRNAFHRPTDG